MSAGPIHVLNEQVASHRPELRVALQNLRHGVHRFLPLGHVAGAGRDTDVVLADPWVVDFFDDIAHLVHNFADRLLLHRVNPRRISLAIHPDNPRNSLRVVDFRYQVHYLSGAVADGPRQVVNVVVSARIALLFAGQNGFTRPFVAGRAEA